MLTAKKWLFVFIIMLSAFYMALQLLIHFTLDTGFPEGKFAIVEEKWVHYYCRGSGGGGPVVMFESDFGIDSRYSWQLIAREVGQTNKVCYYDRLGMGWSGHQPEGFSTEDKVSILSALVKEVAAEQRVILVSHGYGGILSRKYASQYPNKVEAMIFINSAHEEQHARMPEHLSPISSAGAFAKKAFSTVGLCKIGAWASTLGSDSTYARRVKMQRASIEYAEAKVNFAAEGGFYSPLEDQNYQFENIPIIALASKPHEIDGSQSHTAISLWHELQLELANLSKTPQLRLVESDSGNLINISQSDAVKAINDALDPNR
jgi:pimeloyl-ACP methyl ester carboxylesterase